MKININGKEVEAKEVEVLSSVENWSEYKLSDGYTLKAKVVVTKVIVMGDMNNIDGTPQYQVMHQIVIGVKE